MTEVAEPESGAKDRDSATVLEIYRLAVEMADRVSARRGVTNSFFLGTQTALVAVLGLTGQNLRASLWWVSICVTGAGITLSASWAAQLQRYRALNRVKFAVIMKLEEQLPAQIFQDEWEALRRPARPGLGERFLELGTVERRIPWIFAVLHATVLTGRLLS